MNLMQVLKVILSYIVDVMDFWQISLKSGHLLNLVKNRAFVKKKIIFLQTLNFVLRTSAMYLKFFSSSKALQRPQDSQTWQSLLNSHVSKEFSQLVSNMKAPFEVCAVQIW